MERNVALLVWKVVISSTPSPGDNFNISVLSFDDNLIKAEREDIVFGGLENTKALKHP